VRDDKRLDDLAGASSPAQQLVVAQRPALGHSPHSGQSGDCEGEKASRAGERIGAGASPSRVSTEADGVAERVRRECNEQGLPDKVIDRTKLAQIATLAFVGVPMPSRARGSSRDRMSGRLAPAGRPPRGRSGRRGWRDGDRGSDSATRP
jgi:hypothetical protein